jgi:hypothetical protein
MPAPTATKPAAPELHQRLAADLRALAGIAAAHPKIAELLAGPLSNLHLVVYASGTVRAQDITAAAVETGAVEMEVEDLEPIWVTGVNTGVALPAGVVRLTIAQLPCRHGL